MAVDAHDKYGGDAASAETGSVTAANKLFDFLGVQINRLDLVAGELAQLHGMEQLPEAEREVAYVRLYYALEAFITSNHPLVVKREFNSADLRAEIRKNVDVAALPAPLRLIVADHDEQGHLLYELIGQSMVDCLLRYVGPETVQRYIVKAAKDSPMRLAVLSEDGRMHFSPVHAASRDLPPEAFNVVIRSFTNELEKLLVDIVGREGVESNFHNVLERLRRMFDDEIIAHFVALLPEQILPKERVAYMSREMLEKQAVLKVEIKKELDRLRFVMENTRDCVFSTDSARRIIFMNSMCQTVVGFDAAGAVGRRQEQIFRFSKDGSTVDLDHYFDQAVSSGSTYRSNDLQLTKHDGSTINVVMSVTAVRNPTGMPVGSIVLFRDITAEIELERMKS
jgi:PAS domain S-box-containing protein